MKKYFCPLLLVCITFLYFTSCDKVKPPYKEFQQTHTDTGKVRKILLEEFTGHLCINCPNASDLAQQLKTLYGEQLILISIHAGELAEPDPYGTWSYDFRTNTGDSIYKDFKIGDAIPKGLISRTNWGTTNFVLDPGNWGSRIETIKNDIPKASIKIINIYEQTVRNLNSIILYKALTDLTGTYKLCVYLTEDSIIKPQKIPSGTNNSYPHRHVLRGALNSTWGDIIFSGNTPANETDMESYSMTLKSGTDAWNENHCYVVAFIYDAATYEIIQVEEKRVK